MIDKEKDIDYILEKELSIDRYCYIHNFIIDKNKEINRLNNIIDEAREKSIKLQEKYGYILDDLTYLLMQNKNL